MFEGKLVRLAGLRESWSNFLKVGNSRSSGLSLCLIDKLVTLRWCFSFVLNEGEGGEDGNVGSVYRLHVATVSVEQPVRGRV